jgi:hypothetical protein
MSHDFFLKTSSYGTCIEAFLGLVLQHSELPELVRFQYGQNELDLRHTFLCQSKKNWSLASSMTPLMMNAFKIG